MFHYFDCCVEYPDVTRVMMSPGTWQCYVSSDFLNGWINHVEPLAAYLLTRYRAHSANMASLAEFHEKAEFHPRLKALGDDVLLLARERGDVCGYWVFWFDRDVSDCGIGRFYSTDTEETIVAAFGKYANKRSDRLSRSYACAPPAGVSPESGTRENEGGRPALKIDIAKLTGWIRF